MKRTSPPLLALIVCAAPASAGSITEPAPPARPVSIHLAEEIHWTSNALDRAVALPDRYRVTRGSIAYAGTIAGGALRLTAFGEEHAYRKIIIEDDRRAGASAEWGRRFGGRYEVRGSLGYGFSDEGDDIVLGNLVLGTRTRSHTVSAGVEAGIALGGGYALALAASASATNFGETEFEAGLIEPLKLEADTLRPQVTVKLSRTLGPLRLGLGAGAALVAAETLADPSLALSSRLLSAAAEFGWKGEDGLELSGSAGVQALRSRDGAFSQTRPAWNLALAAPLGPRLRLSGTATAKFVTDDTDDPLASWVRRGEGELAFTPSTAWTLGAGAYLERRDNIALGYGESRRGAYAAVRYAPRERINLLLRADIEKRRDDLDGVVRARKLMVAVSGTL